MVLTDAFKNISQKVEMISFVSDSLNPDITIICGEESNKELEDKKHFIEKWKFDPGINYGENN